MPDSTENTCIVTEPFPDNVVVGKVMGAWGLQGDIRVETLTSFPERFDPGSVLYLNGQPTRIERSRTSNKGHIIIKLDTIVDRTGAQGQRGLELTIPAHEIRELPEGSYYHFQIIGMCTWTEQGTYLGTIREILPGGGTEIYVIETPKSKDILIPARSEIIIDINVSENKMIVRVPKSLMVV